MGCHQVPGNRGSFLLRSRDGGAFVLRHPEELLFVCVQERNAFSFCGFNTRQIKSAILNSTDACQTTSTMVIVRIVMITMTSEALFQGLV